MSKKYGPGLFGKRVDVEGAVTSSVSKEIHQEIQGGARELFLRQTREMNDQERELMLEAEGIVDRFLSRRFSDHLPRISNATIRIVDRPEHSRNAFILNEFIELLPPRNRSERANLDFLNIAVHEILHYCSARRRFVAKTSVVDQVGIAIVSLGDAASRKWFEGLNEAMVSSLQHRMTYDFALSEDSGILEDLKRQIRTCREQALARNDDDSAVLLMDEEVYSFLEDSEGVKISWSYFDERVFLRLLIEKTAESSHKTIESVQEQFDRVALYGWDQETKRGIIQAVGADVWRALAWMKPEEFFLADRRENGYAGLFYRIVNNDRDGAQRIARAIVQSKQHPGEPAWHRAAAKDWQDEDVFVNDVDDEL